MSWFKNWINKLFQPGGSTNYRLVALESSLQRVQIENETLKDELELFRAHEEQNKAKYDSVEPWVEIRSAEFNEVKGIRIELDWNDAFVQHLKESGIKGKSDDEIV